MKIAARLIYYKAVTPTMDVFELPDETWREFLYAKNARRIEIVCKLRNTPWLRSHVREIAWIPLGHQNKLVEVEEKQ